MKHFNFLWKSFSNIFSKHLLLAAIFSAFMFSISENDHFSGDDFPILVISRFNQSSANWIPLDRAALWQFSPIVIISSKTAFYIYLLIIIILICFLLTIIGSFISIFLCPLQWLLEGKCILSVSLSFFLSLPFFHSLNYLHRLYIHYSKWKINPILKWRTLISSSLFSKYFALLFLYRLHPSLFPALLLHRYDILKKFVLDRGRDEAD